jgi:hypothetical protein
MNTSSSEKDPETYRGDGRQENGHRKEELPVVLASRQVLR